MTKAGGSSDEGGEGPPLTQGDSSTEDCSHQSSCRRSVDFIGALYEPREALEDAAGDADVVNTHEAASRKGDAPVLLQVQHLRF